MTRKKKGGDASPMPLSPLPASQSPAPPKAAALDADTHPYAPTKLKDTPLSHQIHHIPAAVLVSVLSLSFGQFVDNPVSFLATHLVTTTLAQAAYLFYCLDPPGQQHGKTDVDSQALKKKAKGKSTVIKNDRLSTDHAIIRTPLTLVTTLLVGTPILYILLVLHGAPLTTHLPHTALAAAHLALLTLPQLLYTHGYDAELWWAVVGVALPIDEPFGGTLGAIVGAWLGAVPIPLDWDREWQKWPVTIVTGMYMGWIVGRLVGQYGLYGKVVAFEEHPDNRDES
ncbi:MAG: Glycosylphosphatidylinositol (GPI) anchor assembly protein [Vezdaea aestivalis]|nr:MAG: Glycosylphosphatidylinositol (GPI) anchor assembly protein [Vezdaea aestivalis]